MFKALAEGKVLIVPLWNWNEEDLPFSAKDNGFNRTFMELKCVSIIVAKVCLAQVLIVPLWNWNMVANPNGAATPGFNRTFMELKYSTKSAIYIGSGAEVRG